MEKEVPECNLFSTVIGTYFMLLLLLLINIIIINIHEH